MKHSKLILALLAVWIFGCSTPYQDFQYFQNDRDYRAWITIKSQDSYLEIRVYCLNNTPKVSILEYDLKAKKVGEAGRTETSQAGSVNIFSQEKKCLSQLGLKVSPKDCYQIKLKVYKDGKLVAEDFVFYSS